MATNKQTRRPAAGHREAELRALAVKHGAGEHGEDAPLDADEEIFHSVREAILDQRLPPGTKLKEVPLSELFGVNRSVVRRALARLAHSRLVDIRPNRGAVVASPSRQESRDVFAARKVLEAAIVAIVARNPKKSHIRELRVLVDRETEAYRRGDSRQGVKLAIEFHRALAAMAGNGVLCELLEDLLTRTPLILLTHRGSPSEPSCQREEHSGIIDLIEAGEVAAAVRASDEHLDHLADQLEIEEAAQPLELADIFAPYRIGRRKS